MKHKVLIIEDELFAQQELIRLLNALAPNFEIVDCLDSVADAIELLQVQNNIDLIFLDIQLSDGLSFEIFQEVEVETPIIFTTAFNEYAIKAFEQNSIDYLLKPIEEEKLQKAIEKYLKLSEKKTAPSLSFSEEQISALTKLVKPKAKSRFISKVGDQIKMIDVDEIAYFFAEENVVFLVQKNGKKVIVDYTIDQLSEVLDQDRFFRINRAFIIALDAILKVHKYFNSRLKLELEPNPNQETLVTRSRVAEFMSWIDR